MGKNPTQKRKLQHVRYNNRRSEWRQEIGYYRKQFRRSQSLLFQFEEEVRKRTTSVVG